MVFPENKEISSLILSASLFVCLDAVDVAFTEAAVGAGIALILFLGALSLIKYKEKNNNWVNELYFVSDEHFNKGGAKFIANLVKNKIIN